MYNAYIIVPLATWAVAQLSKFTLEAFAGRLNFRNLYTTGGMPSVHAAVVTSLATTAGLLDGGRSHLFGLALVLAVIVIYDSLNVRFSVGEQAAALNMIIDSLDSGRTSVSRPQRLREVLGHTPGQVAAGTVLGLVLGGLFNYQRLSWLGNFLSATPSRPELITYLSIAAFILAVSAIIRLVTRQRVRRLASWRRLTRNLLMIGVGALVLELLFSFGAIENASFLVWRAWTLLTAAVAVVLVLAVAWSGLRRLPTEEAQVSEAERKDKWLKPAKKRRKR